MVVLTSNVSSYVTKNKKEKNWNFKLKEVDKTKKNDDEGDEVHYEMDVDNVGIKQEEEDGEQFGIEPEEIYTIDTEDRLSDCSYHPDPEDVDEAAEINDDDGDGEISGGIKCEVVLLYVFYLFFIIINAQSPIELC